MRRAAELRRLAPAAQGYLVVETERGRRELALGPSTSVGGELPMLDWRTAPLAEVLFRHGAGEAYEVSVGERAQEGRVVARWIVERGGLRGEEQWVPDGGEARRIERPGPVQKPAPDRQSLVVLDPVQQAAVELPADRSLVVDGEAGVGKTLVALYRVAELQRRCDRRGRPLRALVLVPTEGLRRLVRLLAERLALRKLEVEVFEPWLLARGRAAFPGLPKRTSEGATAQVIALKRHPAVRAVLGDFVGWKPPRGVERDDAQGRARTRLLHLWGDGPRLLRVIEAANAAAGAEEHGRGVGALPARAIAAVQQHTRLQYEATAEQIFRHVDADRLAALDGRRLDAGTDRQDADTFDVEDVPVLFELARRGALPTASGLARYDHIVVDEAQLRAPLELAMVGDALFEHGTVTLAGDHRQASDESAWFAGWEAARAELRRGTWSEVTLEVTYRSVPEISDFARGIVERSGRLAPAAGQSSSLQSPSTEPVTAENGSTSQPASGSESGSGSGSESESGSGSGSESESGSGSGSESELGSESDSALASPSSALCLTRCEHALSQAAQICWHLDALLARDPWRQICVIARTPDHARRLHAELRGLDATLVLDGDFRFEPGVLVTTASAVSGLEFDAVVLPDLTPSFYPPHQPELARALYVAATRARDWLWLLTPDEWSPLLDARAAPAAGC